METFEERGKNFLKHHGILGQKWGIRKEQKRLASKNVADYRLGIQKKLSVKSKLISKAEYDKLDKKPVKIAGAKSTLYRVTAKSNRNSLGSNAYVSISKSDNNKYVALLDPHGETKSDKYQLTLTNAKALVSPSEKVRIDTFIKTLNDQVPLPNSRQTVLGRQYLETDPISKGLSSFELGLKTYNDFAQAQVMNTPIHTAYFNRLRDAGYNSLVDDADKGLITDMPIIVFPDVSGTSITSTTKLSKDDVLDAQLKLK